MNTPKTFRLVLLTTLALGGCASSSSDTGTEGADIVERGGTQTASNCAGNEGKATIDVFEDAEGKFRFHFKAGNGEILLTSTKGYTTSAEAEKPLFAIQLAAQPNANIYRLEPTADGQFQIKVYLPKSSTGQEGGDEELVAISEGYASKSNAERARLRTAQILECMPKG